MKYKNKAEAINAIVDENGKCINPNCKGHDDTIITLTLRVSDLRKILSAIDYYDDEYKFNTVEIKRLKSSMDLHSVKAIQPSVEETKFIKLF